MMVEALYEQLIAAWNKRDADAFAELFILDGECIGFDGSTYTGRGEIHEQIKKVFADHPTQPYKAKVLGVITVTTDVAIVRAVAGMAKPGKQDLEPSLHAMHRLTAVLRGGDWRIALFQNTPAQPGRTEDVTKLTELLNS